MIEDKLMPEDASIIAQNPVVVVETCFEGYNEEETKAMSKRLVRLIDFRVLPVLILLFLVNRRQIIAEQRAPCLHETPSI